MKKILVSILLFLISISLSFAQSDTSRKAKFFIKTELYPGFYKFPNSENYCFGIGAGFIRKRFSSGVLFSFMPNNSEGLWVINQIDLQNFNLTGGNAGQGGLFFDYHVNINKRLFIIERAMLFYGYANYFTIEKKIPFDYFSFTIGNGMGYKHKKFLYEFIPLCLGFVKTNINYSYYLRINLGITYLL